MAYCKTTYNGTLATAYTAEEEMKLGLATRGFGNDNFRIGGFKTRYGADMGQDWYWIKDDVMLPIQNQESNNRPMADLDMDFSDFVEIDLTYEYHKSYHHYSRFCLLGKPSEKKLQTLSTFLGDPPPPPQIRKFEKNICCK